MPPQKSCRLLKFKMRSINYSILANTVPPLVNVNCWQKLKRGIHFLFSLHLWFRCAKIWFSIFTLHGSIHTPAPTCLPSRGGGQSIQYYISQACLLTISIVVLIEGFTENRQGHY